MAHESRRSAVLTFAGPSAAVLLALSACGSFGADEGPAPPAAEAGAAEVGGPSEAGAPDADTPAPVVPVRLVSNEGKVSRLATSLQHVSYTQNVPIGNVMRLAKSAGGATAPDPFVPFRRADCARGPRQPRLRE